MFRLRIREAVFPLLFSVVSWRMETHLALFTYLAVSVVNFGSSAISLIFKEMALGTSVCVCLCVCVCVF